MIELNGTNVTLKPIQSIDIEPLWKIVYSKKNPEWKKWDAPYFPLQDKTLEKFKKEFKPNNKLAIWVNDKLIGTVCYYWEHKPSNWLEVGITIYTPQYWSSGYGTEALKLWLSYLFKIKPLVRIGLTTWSGNKGMMKCAEKLGMRQEACLRKCRFWQGQYYDSLKYGVLRVEWFHT